MTTADQLDPRLLEILACPEDKGPLYYLGDDAGLYNPRLRRRYVVNNGIPVMLPDEAVDVPAAEAAADAGAPGGLRFAFGLRPEETGADAIATIAPSFFKPASTTELVGWCARVAA